MSDETDNDDVADAEDAKASKAEAEAEVTENGGADNLPHEAKIQMLVGIIGDMTDDQMTKNDGPKMVELRKAAPFHVDDAMRDEAWGLSRADVPDPTEPEQSPEEPVVRTDIADVTIDGNEVSVSRADFKLMDATWKIGGEVVSKMWRHNDTGTKFYEDNKRVNDRGLPVYPFEVNN